MGARQYPYCGSSSFHAWGGTFGYARLRRVLPLPKLTKIAKLNSEKIDGADISTLIRMKKSDEL